MTQRQIRGIARCFKNNLEMFPEARKALEGTALDIANYLNSGVSATFHRNNFLRECGHSGYHDPKKK